MQTIDYDCDCVCDSVVMGRDAETLLMNANNSTICERVGYITISVAADLSRMALIFFSIVGAYGLLSGFLHLCGVR